MTPYIEHCQNVPKWMINKVATIARNFSGESNVQNAYNQLVFEAATVLQAELKTISDLSLIVPKEFVLALEAGTGTNLSHLECTAIIILQNDAGKAMPINIDEHFEEYLHLKWESLNFLLERNSDE